MELVPPTGVRVAHTALGIAPGLPACALAVQAEGAAELGLAAVVVGLITE
ncbi:hypothetical protein AB0M28_08260 [Streptomyces sp. NPDC051940]